MGRIVELEVYVALIAIIGDNSNIYGTLGHKFRVKNDVNKKAPVIEDNVTVGLGSVVLEDVIIEDNAYIAANAIITQNIEYGQRVRKINELF